ncbi:MAG: MFS transporter [Phycisphaerae bacterium]
MPVSDLSASSHSGPRPPDLLLRNRNFALLWCAYGISALGDHLSEMGLLQLQDALNPRVEDMISRKALMTFCFFVPFFLLGPAMGWLADRFARRRLMIFADLVRALCMVELPPLLFALQRWWDPSAPAGGPIAPGVTVLPLLVVGVFAAMFSPARSALLPTLIQPSQLVRANALTAGLGMIATIASYALGGWLVEHAGVRWNFRVDGLTFVGSAMLVACIVVPRRRAPAARTASEGSPIVQGLRYVRDHRRVAEVIAVSAVLWTAAAIVNSLIPALVKRVFGGGYMDIGKYQGLLGAGLLTGALLLTLFGDALRSELAMSWSLMMSGAAGLFTTAGLLLNGGRVWCGAGIFLIGLFGAGVQVGVAALLQRMVPNQIRGRVFGVHDLATIAGLLLATGLLGIPRWPGIDRYLPALTGLTAAGLLAAGVTTTRVRLRRGRFGAAITFWRNLNEFYCRLWSRARRVGRCTIPAEGPVIVAANHHSSLDPFLLSATSPNRYISFMVAREFTKLPGFRRLLELVECVPVNRSGMDVASVKAALRHLSSGRALGIFPQGGIVSPDDRSEPRDGVGLLALRSGATVIPAFVSGVQHTKSVAWPFLRRQRARVRYGPAVDLSRFAGREGDRAAYTEASAEIMRAIRALA